MVSFLIIGLCLWFLLGNFLFFVNWTMVKPRLCDCLFCASLILWSGFLLLVCVCDFYWVISCFLWMVFFFFFSRILKFQRVAHNGFLICAASHCVVISLFAFFIFYFYMSSWRNLMIETKQWAVGSYSTSWNTCTKQKQHHFTCWSCL